MYQDNSLLPREAVRLAALGILANSPRTYAALAAEVRNFASRIAGPSLDLMGTSIELLRHEGLIEPANGADADLTDALFNLGPSPPTGFQGWTLKCMGSVGPLGITWTGRAVLLKNRGAYRAYLEQLAGISSLSILCVAHGDPVHGDVSQALRDAAKRV